MIEERPDVAPIALTNDVPPMADYMDAQKLAGPSHAASQEQVNVFVYVFQTVKRPNLYWMRPLSKKEGYDH
jgi:hypothetical protein